MSLRDLPPLGLLVAFEAAGRLESFKAASRELHLTPSAISQQIKALEEALDVELFERAGRAVSLTPRGARYHREVQNALREVARAGRGLRRVDDDVLRITTAPLVAHEFLLPGLAEFQACFPNVALHIESSTQVVDLAQDDFHAAIRVGNGSWPGLHARAFGRIEVAPVCAPALAAKIRSASDLAAQTLIVVRGQERGHEPFLPDGLTLVRARRTLSFDSCFEAMRAAEHGLGVAVGIFPVVTSWVHDDRLAVPLALRHVLPGSAYLAYRIADAERFPFRRITEWIEARYRALPSLPQGRLVAA